MRDTPQTTVGQIIANGDNDLTAAGNDLLKLFNEIMH
jgi:hypothetical protein